MSICKSCGNQIPDGTKFCVICGAAQTQPPQAPQQNDPAVQNVQQPYTPQEPVQPQQNVQQPYTPQEPVQPQQNVQQPYTPQEPVQQPQQNVQQPYTPQEPVQQPQQSVQQPYTPQEPVPPQQQNTQQSYAQQNTNTASQNITEETKKKKKRKIPLILKILIIIVLVIGIALTAMIVIGRIALSNADKASYYEIGSDSIPSLRQVLGDPETLKLTGLSSGVSSDGTSTKEYQYESEGANNGLELYTYAMYLNNQGYSFLTDGNFANTSGNGVKMGRNASETGYAIILQFDWQPGKYKILITRQKGTVTVNTPTPPPEPPVNPDPANNDAESLMNADLIRWIKNGEYYFEAEILGEDGSRGQTLFGKQGSNAALEIDLEGNIVRVVQKGNDIYYISPAERTVYITKVSETDSFTGPNFDSYTITGSGSGSFDGQTLQYVRYIPAGSPDESLCWFKNGDLYAIQPSDGSAIIVKNAANVPPSSLFDIPSDYQVTDVR